MSRSRSVKSWLVLSGLLAFATPAGADIALRGDGWHRWEVPAGAGGRNACCYEFRKFHVTGAVGCRLGHGENDLDPTDNCDVTSDLMHIYVEVKDGAVREIQALSSKCPVSVDGQVRVQEGVSSHDSIAWLLRQVKDHPRHAEEAIMTVSFHAEGEALAALIGLIEDTSQKQDAREDALFWLVQTESEEAFAYLDRLLD